MLNIKKSVKKPLSNCRHALGEEILGISVL